MFPIRYSPGTNIFDGCFDVCKEEPKLQLWSVKDKTPAQTTSIAHGHDICSRLISNMQAHSGKTVQIAVLATYTLLVESVWKRLIAVFCSNGCR